MFSQKNEVNERKKYASSIKKAATVYGDVRSQSGECQRQMSFQKGCGGILPQTEGWVQEKTQ
jgi:hypothetical protein